jgi:ubiquinol-cytochrome c reductase cytochrome b subunit
MYGPFEGWKIASPSQPDWYIAWLDGSLRLGPAISLTLFGHTISPLFWSGIVLPLVLFGCMFAWPEIERSLTHDDLPHNLDDMPYEKPWRLGIGVAVFTFGTVLGMASSDDLQANYWHIDVESLLVVYRILLVVAPIAFGLLAVVIGSELRTRFETRSGQAQVRRAILIRNAQGGYDEQNV